MQIYNLKVNIMKVAILLLAIATVGVFAQEAESSGPPPFQCDGNAFTCAVRLGKPTS